VGEGRRIAWIDLVLRDLSRAIGHPLPPALVGLVRRVLEYPSGYVDMGALEALTGLSVGALKARFRRRGMPSPFSYLRWLRCFAVASRLQHGANVADAARRLGWTSTGNLCRYIYTTTGHAPSALGADGAWEMLVAAFATKHLGPVALDAWEGLDDLFLRTTVA
jgi:AraC-like DNA-binding protein